MKLFPNIFDACGVCRGGDCGDCFGGFEYNGKIYRKYEEAKKAEQDFLKYHKNNGTLLFCDICGNECFPESADDNNTTCNTCQQKESLRKKVSGFMQSIIEEFDKSEGGYDNLEEFLYELINDFI